MPGFFPALTIGVLFLAWIIITLTLLIEAWRGGHILLVSLLILVLLTMPVFGIGMSTGGNLGETNGWLILSGYLGLLTSIIAWYGMLAMLLRETKGPFLLPIGSIKSI